MASVVQFVNDVGRSAVDGVSSFIALNYFLGDKIFQVISFVASTLASAVLAVLVAARILLEDLAVFAAETVDTLVAAVFFVISAVDRFFSGVTFAASVVKASVFNAANAVHSAWTSAAAVASGVASKTANFFSLLGASVVLLIQLVPKTIYLLADAFAAFFRRLGASIRAGVISLVDAFVSAPFEMFVGLLAGVAITYAVVRITRKLVREYDITPAVVLRSTVKVVCFLYINFVRGVLAFLVAILHAVTMSLGHLHVPRFHHAGDSDVEDEEDNRGLVGPVDDSDDEDRAREEQKRRNYDLLVKRRANRRTNGGKKGKNGNDVEDMLFEQVEREREDKLCVICQDQEKCIMILPCRHLCICQGCQDPLMAQPNKLCPICRKQVRQTIKAYL